MTWWQREAWRLGCLGQAITIESVVGCLGGDQLIWVANTTVHLDSFLLFKYSVSVYV